MPNINLKGIPTKLYLRLKKSAKDNRRSLTGEIIYRLEQTMTSARSSMAAAKKS
jgi:hypothetical protein